MIKKIITIILIAIFSFSSTFAYTQTELNSKKTIYKKVLTKKLGTTLDKFWEDKLKKIIILIDKIVLKYNNSKTISDSKKLKKVAILTALKEIINEKLEDDFSDVDNILNEVNKKIEVIVIDDKRCWDKCNTSAIVTQLKQIKDLSTVTFKRLDFDEEEAKDLMTKNWIKKLPAVIFSDNSIKELSNYLTKTPANKYSLELGSQFDPYAKMSAKWFKILDKKVITQIKNSSYIKWNKNAKILWLEYSDMQCPFCAKLHYSGTPDDLEKKYWNKLSYSLQHFPLGFHKNALPAAHALECVWKEKWADIFYKLETIIFKNKNSDLEYIKEEAVKLWVNKTKLETCIKNKEFSSKINSQQKFWTETFWITWTPWNVLINTETWEYEIISGAYPTSKFIEVIDKLLK